MIDNRFLRSNICEVMESFDYDFDIYINLFPLSNKSVFLIELKYLYEYYLGATSIYKCKDGVIRANNFMPENRINGITNRFRNDFKIIINFLDSLNIDSLNIQQKNKKQYDKSIFKNEYASLLFNYFLDNYIIDDKSKYIQIYRYLESDLICSQEKYRAFINDLIGVSISKITTENYNAQLILKEREKEFKKIYNIDK